MSYFLQKEEGMRVAKKISAMTYMVGVVNAEKAKFTNN